MLNNVLSEFKKFLISRKFVSEKNVIFYAHWVNRFIDFSKSNSDVNLDLLVEKYKNHLSADTKIQDWEIKQALEAISLYLNNFLKGKTSKVEIKINNGIENRNLELNVILLKLRDALRVKHYAYRTERSYIEWAKRFYLYVTKIKNKDVKAHGFDLSDFKDYLSYLALNKGVSSSTQNQAFSAILFVLRDLLNIEIGDIGKTVRAKRGPKLPVVLSVDEVRLLFEKLEGKSEFIIKLIYGSGLRLMEAVRLRVKDVDFDNNVIIVRSGRGDKDRSTILPESLREDLKLHLEKVKEIHKKDLLQGHGDVFLPEAIARKYGNASREWGWQYVFPARNLSVDPRNGNVRRHHIYETTIQKAIKKAVRDAGIAKNASVHTLRHSFATHMLLNGVNIREIQDLLGHKNLETTMIYTHIIKDIRKKAVSPLDILVKSTCSPEGAGKCKVV